MRCCERSACGALRSPSICLRRRRKPCRRHRGRSGPKPLRFPDAARLGGRFWAVTLGASLAAVVRGGDEAGLPPWSWPPRRRGSGSARGRFCPRRRDHHRRLCLAIRDEANQQQFNCRVLDAAVVRRRRDTPRCRAPKRGGRHSTLRCGRSPSTGSRSPSSVRTSSRPRHLDTGDPGAVTATAQKAEARLYRPDDNRLYRSVSALVGGG